jgi:hypothetical protein
MDSGNFPVSEMLPICSVRDVPGLYLRAYPLPPGFSQVFIPKGLKVLCFATLLQVLIVKRLKSKNASRECWRPGIKTRFYPRLTVHDG